MEKQTTGNVNVTEEIIEYGKIKEQLRAQINNDLDLCRNKVTIRSERTA
jgi:hypothetical protein